MVARRNAFRDSGKFVRSEKEESDDEWKTNCRGAPAWRLCDAHEDWRRLWCHLRFLLLCRICHAIKKCCASQLRFPFLIIVLAAMDGCIRRSFHLRSGRCPLVHRGSNDFDLRNGVGARSTISPFDPSTSSKRNFENNAPFRPGPKRVSSTVVDKTIIANGQWFSSPNGLISCFVLISSFVLIANLLGIGTRILGSFVFVVHLHSESLWPRLHLVFAWRWNLPRGVIDAQRKFSRRFSNVSFQNGCLREHRETFKYECFKWNRRGRRESPANRRAAAAWSADPWKGLASRQPSRRKVRLDTASVGLVDSHP